MKKIVLLPLLITLFASCHTTKRMETNLPAFDTEAHRGGRGLMPENTIPAMLHGLSLGVTTLEMDALITKDKQVVLSHDPFFNHDITTRPDESFISEKEERSYALYGMIYADIQQYDVGMKPHPGFPMQQKLKATKPLLRLVIDSAEAYAASTHRPPPFYNIETKTKPATDNIFHPAPDEFVTLLMNIILEKKITDRVIIQSFDPRTLQIVHQRYPAVKTALLIEGFDKRSLDEQLQQLGFVPTIYSPAYKLVNAALLAACHQKNIKVVAWTVNSKPEIQALKDLGVDGIISDYPNLF